MHELFLFFFPVDFVSNFLESQTVVWPVYILWEIEPPHDGLMGTHFTGINRPSPVVSLILYTLLYSYSGLSGFPPHQPVCLMVRVVQ